MFHHIWAMHNELMCLPHSPWLLMMAKTCIMQILVSMGKLSIDREVQIFV